MSCVHCVSASTKTRSKNSSSGETCSPSRMAAVRRRRCPVCASTSTRKGRLAATLSNTRLLASTLRRRADRLRLRLRNVARHEHLARDDQALDLGRALVQLHDLRVTHELLDRVLLDEAVAAVDL